MDFRRKWKCFWTLTRNPNAGFTLVELIVVIAIVAILAGVSVPIYQGYTEKASKAFDAEDVDAATISILERKFKNISTCTMDGTDLLDKVPPYFNTYYADNLNSMFSNQGINSLVWNPDTDVFEISDSFAPTRVQLSGGAVVISPEDTQDIPVSLWWNQS